MIIVGKKIDKLKKLSGWNICITAKSETNITQIKKENIKIFICQLDLRFLSDWVKFKV